MTANSRCTTSLARNLRSTRNPASDVRGAWKDVLRVYNPQDCSKQHSGTMLTSPPATESTPASSAEYAPMFAHRSSHCFDRYAHLRHLCLNRVERGHYLLVQPIRADLA